jgi:hypothetical protein
MKHFIAVCLCFFSVASAQAGQQQAPVATGSTKKPTLDQLSLPALTALGQALSTEHSLWNQATNGMISAGKTETVDIKTPGLKEAQAQRDKQKEELKKYPEANKLFNDWRHEARISAQEKSREAVPKATDSLKKITRVFAYCQAVSRNLDKYQAAVAQGLEEQQKLAQQKPKPSLFGYWTGTGKRTLEIEDAWDNLPETGETAETTCAPEAQEPTVGDTPEPAAVLHVVHHVFVHHVVHVRD